MLASCKHEPAAIPVKGVDLTERALILYVGEQHQLRARLRPADATNTNLSWNTGNPAVATVSEGLVEAVSKGSASISVKTEDGGYEDSALVTVLERPYIPPEVGGNGGLEEKDYGEYE